MDPPKTSWYQGERKSLSVLKGLSHLEYDKVYNKQKCQHFCRKLLLWGICHLNRNKILPPKTEKKLPKNVYHFTDNSSFRAYFLLEDFYKQHKKMVIFYLSLKQRNWLICWKEIAHNISKYSTAPFITHLVITTWSCCGSQIFFNVEFYKGIIGKWLWNGHFPIIPL